MTDTLSNRENEVLGLLARGFSNKEVARRLSLSVRTVETHRLNLRRKTRTGRLSELIRLARARDLLDEDVSAEVAELRGRLAAAEERAACLQRDGDRLDALDRLRLNRCGSGARAAVSWELVQTDDAAELRLVGRTPTRPLRWVLDDLLRDAVGTSAARAEKPGSRDEARPPTGRTDPARTSGPRRRRRVDEHE